MYFVWPLHLKPVCLVQRGLSIYHRPLFILPLCLCCCCCCWWCSSGLFDRVTLDTPMNRKFMPDADFGSWTSLEYVAEWVQRRDKESFFFSHVDAHVSCHWRNMIILFLLQDVALKYNNSTHHCPEMLIQTQALCIRTQADMVYFSTDRIYPITFDAPDDGNISPGVSDLRQLLWGHICIWLLIFCLVK